MPALIPLLQIGLIWWKQPQPVRRRTGGQGSDVLGQENAATPGVVDLGERVVDGGPGPAGELLGHSGPVGEVLDRRGAVEVQVAPHERGPGMGRRLVGDRVAEPLVGADEGRLGAGAGAIVIVPVSEAARVRIAEKAEKVSGSNQGANSLGILRPRAVPSSRLVSTTPSRASWVASMTSFITSVAVRPR